MKKVVLACIGGLTPLLLLGALASATTTTSLDIGKLSGAESRTVALLRQYQPTATWSAQFNAAEANQASDLAKVNSDLWPSHQVRPVSKPRVGSRQKIGALSVKLVAVETVQADDSDAGTRSVAAKFQVADIATEPASDSPDNDVTLIGDNDQPYSQNGLLAPSCSDFGDGGQMNLASQETLVGCVVVEVPDRVRIVKVQWVPNSGQGPGVYFLAVP
jgi:hypothetical protein